MSKPRMSAETRAYKKRLREAGRQERQGIIINVLRGLLLDYHEARRPDPGECIPSLTMEHGWDRFPLDDEIKIEFEEVANARGAVATEFILKLREIPGIKKRRCPKCSSTLPVIKTLNADENRHTYFEWKIYCTICWWIHEARRPMDQIDSIERGDRPIPRFQGP